MAYSKVKQVKKAKFKLVEVHRNIKKKKMSATIHLYLDDQDLGKRILQKGDTAVVTLNTHITHETSL